jgi:hypothetical protein
MRIDLFGLDSKICHEFIAKIENDQLDTLVYDSISIDNHEYNFIVHSENIVCVLKDHEYLAAGKVVDDILGGVAVHGANDRLRSIIRQFFLSHPIDQINDTNSRLQRYGLQLVRSAKVIKIQTDSLEEYQKNCNKLIDEFQVNCNILIDKFRKNCDQLIEKFKES